MTPNAMTTHLYLKTDLVFSATVLFSSGAETSRYPLHDRYEHSILSANL